MRSYGARDDSIAIRFVGGWRVDRFGNIADWLGRTAVDLDAQPISCAGSSVGLFWQAIMNGWVGAA